MRIVDGKVIVCSPGRNFVTLKLVTEDGIYGLGDATLGYKLSNGANQLKTLSWTNVNTISIQFSEAVTLGQNDLAIIGASNGLAIPSFSGFSWDSATKTATWCGSAASTPR